jgi:hypothetical protein
MHELIRTPDLYPGRQRDLSMAVRRAIPVESLMFDYGVSVPETQEAIRTFPTLSYLLGRVSSEKRAMIRVDKPELTGETVNILEDGSGMYGLKDRDDALRWKGIMNHVLGTVRGSVGLFDTLKTLSDNDRASMKKLGYDFSSFDRAERNLIVDSGLVVHAGRRGMDEYQWYGMSDHAHPTGDSYINTVALFAARRAHPALFDMLHIEDHTYLDSGDSNEVFADVLTNILTYCDWRWAQSPLTLDERFEGLRKSGRAPEVRLEHLYSHASVFDRVLSNILGKDFFSRVIRTDGAFVQSEWLIRKGYAASAGLTLQEVFPEFKADVSPETGLR